MPEQTLLSVEGPHDRATIAAYFRQVAEGLEADGSVTFSTDEDEVSLTIPEMPAFEVEIEQETEDDETEYELEFELEWSTADHATESATETLEIGTEADEPAAAEPSADDEAQQTLDEGDAEGGSDTESSDAEMEPIDPPHGRTEGEAAEDDESSQDTDTTESR